MDEPSIPTNFQSRLTRDLQWVVSSPSLISSSATAKYGAGVQQPTDLAVEDIDLNALTAFLRTRQSRRVGHYFETLTEFWLKHIRGCEILASREQLRVENNAADGTSGSKTAWRTIGELDFVFRDQTRVTHLETAVKFYLYYEPENESGSHLIGPNATDNFERKTERLFEHQLQLGKRFYEEVEIREAMVRGRIFHHPLQSLPETLPEFLSEDHLRGVWIYDREQTWFDQFGDSVRFMILQKPHWLADESAAVDDPNLLTVEELKRLLSSHFSAAGYPFLVSVLKSDNDLLQESQRVFVVPDTWPQFT